jgi:hypothetical protein
VKVLLVVLAALTLGACGVRGTGERFLSDQDIEAKDDSTCADLGAAKGSQVYVDCRLRLRSDRSQQDQSRRMRRTIGTVFNG